MKHSVEGRYMGGPEIYVSQREGHLCNRRVTMAEVREDTGEAEGAVR